MTPHVTVRRVDNGYLVVLHRLAGPMELVFHDIEDVLKCVAGYVDPNWRIGTEVKVLRRDESPAQTITHT